MSPNKQEIQDWAKKQDTAPISDQNVRDWIAQEITMTDQVYGGRMLRAKRGSAVQMKHAKDYGRRLRILDHMAKRFADNQTTIF